MHTAHGTRHTVNTARGTRHHHHTTTHHRAPPHTTAHSRTPHTANRKPHGDRGSPSSSTRRCLRPPSQLRRALFPVLRRAGCSEAGFFRCRSCCFLSGEIMVSGVFLAACTQSPVFASRPRQDERTPPSHVPRPAVRVEQMGTTQGTASHPPNVYRKRNVSDALPSHRPSGRLDQSGIHSSSRPRPPALGDDEVAWVRDAGFPRGDRVLVKARYPGAH